MRPVWENDRVRVLEVIWEPGAAVAATKLKGEDIGILGVVLKGGTMEHTQANGKKVRRERHTGDILWEIGTAQIEARQNVGKDRIGIIQARLKKLPPTRAYKGPVAGVKKLFENPRLIAFEQVVGPKQKYPLHAYAPRLWVAITGGRLRSTDKSGKVQEANFQDGQIMWIEAQEQVLENSGNTSIRLISVEMK